MTTYPVLRRETFVIPSGMFRTAQRPTHGGVDFTPVVQGAAEVVVAVESGKIVISDKMENIGDTSGLDVMILTPSGRRWWYGHLSRVDVNVGDYVREGARIGLIGSTGKTSTGKATSTGAHLHLELHYPSMNVEIDPWPYIKDAPDIKGETFAPESSRVRATANYPKISVGSTGTTMEDDVALTDREKNTLEWLWTKAPEIDWWMTRRAQFDNLYEKASQLYERRGVIDSTKTVVDELHRLITSGALTADVPAAVEVAPPAELRLSEEDLLRVAKAVADELHRRGAE